MFPSEDYNGSVKIHVLVGMFGSANDISGFPISGDF